MWFLRCFHKDYSNQVFFIKEGIQTIGRGPDCNIVLPFHSVSKKHAEIELKENEVFIRDLDSKNGIAVNGHRVKESKLQSGDKILIHKVLLELTSIDRHLKKNQNHLSTGSLTPPSALSLEKNAHLEEGKELVEKDFLSHSDKELEKKDGIHLKEGSETNGEQNTKGKKGLSSLFNQYIHRVFLPGIYKLIEWVSFKGAIGICIIVFIFCFTFFSFFPIFHAFQSKALEEGKLRALTVAKSIASLNKEAILNEMFSRVNFSMTQSEKEIQKAFIVSSKSGLIIAPSFLSGQYPKVPFLNADMKKSTESIYSAKNNQIIARFPINQYDPDINFSKPVAQSVVVYNFKNLQIGGDEKLSFFIQSFLISLVAGFFLYYLIVQLSAHPIQNVNQQLDRALSNQNENIEFSYDYPEMKKLVSNINSALNRMTSKEDPEDSNFNSSFDPSHEMDNLIQLMEWVGIPASTVLVPENKFGVVNKDFAERVNSDISDLVQHSVDEINDQALRLSFLDLIENVKDKPGQMGTNQLELGSTNYNITAQSISGSGDVVYILIVLLPEYQEEGLDEMNSEEEESFVEGDDVENA